MLGAACAVINRVEQDFGRSTDWYRYFRFCIQPPGNPWWLDFEVKKKGTKEKKAEKAKEVVFDGSSNDF